MTGEGRETIAVTFWRLLWGTVCYFTPDLALPQKKNNLYDGKKANCFEVRLDDDALWLH